MNEQQVLFQVAAAREAGMVERCHALPHVRSYTVASHSYGAASLLLLLHPGPSVALIRAVMFHDVAERWLGDMPSPAKRDFALLGQVYEETEKHVLKQLQMLPELTPEEQNWLAAVDLLDLQLWTREEAALGNAYMEQWEHNCRRALDRLKAAGRLPPEVLTFIERILPLLSSGLRHSDYIRDILKQMDGPKQATA